MLETQEEPSAVLAGTLLRNALDDAEPMDQMRRVVMHLNQHYPQADDQAATSLAMTTLHLVIVGGTSAGLLHSFTGAPTTAFLMTLNGPQPASTLVLRLFSRQIDRMESGRDQWQQEFQVIEDFINGTGLEDATEVVSLMSDAAVFAAYAAAASCDSAAANLPTPSKELLAGLTAALPGFSAPRPQKKRSSKRRKWR